ncbi:MAG: rpfC [Phycisphaerales bacterium]|nr:rpfC [Phycisphaerales bacterium]
MGDGISPEFLPHVFDRFRQQDARTTRRRSGLGLGLSIVRQLVEFHGGGAGRERRAAGPRHDAHLHDPVAAAHPEAVAVDGHPGGAGDVRAAPQDPSLKISGVRMLGVNDEPDAPTVAAFSGSVRAGGDEGRVGGRGLGG